MAAPFQLHFADTFELTPPPPTTPSRCDKNQCPDRLRSLKTQAGRKMVSSCSAIRCLQRTESHSKHVDNATNKKKRNIPCCQTSEAQPGVSESELSWQIPRAARRWRLRYICQPARRGGSAKHPGEDASDGSQRRLQGQMNQSRNTATGNSPYLHFQKGFKRWNAQRSHVNDCHFVTEWIEPVAVQLSGEVEATQSRSSFHLLAERKSSAAATRRGIRSQHRRWGRAIRAKADQCRWKSNTRRNFSAELNALREPRWPILIFFFSFHFR